MKMKHSDPDVTGFSAEETVYPVEDGTINVREEHVEAAVAHGFTPVVEETTDSGDLDEEVEGTEEQPRRKKKEK